MRGMGLRAAEQTASVGGQRVRVEQQPRRAVLAVLVWQLGSAPFLHGLQAVDARSVAGAAGTGLLATVACAWRWRLVARRLGAGLPLQRARRVRAGDAVDRHVARHQLLGRGHPGVAGSDDLVHPPDRLRAVGQGRHRVRSTRSSRPGWPKSSVAA